MPSKLDALDPSAIDRDSKDPLHSQLADHIRQLIASRDLEPGDTFPSEARLGELVGISRTAVRDALDELVGEGLIVKNPGERTAVATPPDVRRMSMDRYQPTLDALAEGKQPETAFVVENHAEWDDFTLDPFGVTKEKASTQDAEYLEVRKGVSQILRRRMVMCIKGKPLQIHRSALPWKLAGQTPLTDPSTYPHHGGTLAELHLIGVTPTEWWEAWSARMPNRRERELLDMRTTGPVWDIVRVFYRDAAPVEASRVIVPCARMVMHNRGQLAASPGR